MATANSGCFCSSPNVCITIYTWWQLTLNVRGPSYLGLTRSISCLLMPWLLTSPGHQHPWYWLCRKGRSCLTWGRIPSTCVISTWSKDIKCKCMFLFPLNNLTCKGLSIKGLHISHSNPPRANKVATWAGEFFSHKSQTQLCIICCDKCKILKVRQIKIFWYLEHNNSYNNKHI